MRKRILLSWSSGKDGAWALHLLRRRPDVEVAGLLTTLNAEFDRVAMHAVRSELLRRQSEAVGLPLHVVPLPWPCPNERYEALMREFIEGAVRDGIEGMAFGDLFLEEIRAYREEKLRGTGVEPLFPLWELPTDALAREMISGGVRAVVTCVDPRQLPPEFAGREYDEAFLADLPPTVDPCGERGEFHTFCYDGPAFRHPVGVAVGETVERDGFVFTDLLPAPE
jgi:uncharacterized protein (TIGR00290 family)